jgi:hypothetical protein
MAPHDTQLQRTGYGIMRVPRARRCHYALAAHMKRQRAAAELHVRYTGRR